MFCGMMGNSKSNIPLSWCHCCKEHIKWLYEKTLEKDLSIEWKIVDYFKGRGLCIRVNDTVNRIISNGGFLIWLIAIKS